jgi:rod shape-determining protein MreB
MLKSHISKFQNFLYNDIGIDLGTANTLVYLKGRGIVINEPSVVAVNQKTNQVVAIGVEAKNMLGRTPSHIAAIRPLVGGVISDFEITEEMIAYLIKKAEKDRKKWLSPRVIVGVPCGVTNVETRAVRDATYNSGAREVFIIEQPMAAAIGMRLPVREAVGNFVIDIGGGTTDIALISLGGIVKSKSLKVAGDRFNEDIINYVRNEFKVLIGERTAESVKISVGSASLDDSSMEISVKGRDLVTGLPREILITSSDVRDAITPSLGILLDAAKEVLETAPPEIVSDILQKGGFVVGGGALLKGIDHIFSEYLKVPIKPAHDPLTAVARGTGIVLEDLDNYRDVLIENEDDLPAKE